MTRASDLSHEVGGCLWDQPKVMRHTLLLGTALFFAAITNPPEATTSTNINTPTTMNTPNDRSAIEALLFTYRGALNASSVEQVMPLYTTDGVFMPTGFPTAVGTEQVRGAYAGVFSAIKLNIEFHIDAIDVVGDHAFARTTSQGTTLVHANGQTIPEENRELFVLRRDNGQWLIARYMFNKMK